MNHQNNSQILIVKYIGIIIAILFYSTFITILIIDKKSVEELEFISISTFNFDGMPYINFINIFGYILPGILIILFSYILFKNSIESSSKVGLSFIGISGISWMTLGIIETIPNDEFSGTILLLRITIASLFGTLGLIIYSATKYSDIKNNILKYLTLGIGLSLLLENLYTIEFDYSGIRASIFWGIYFSWFPIFAFNLKT
jgi:hypothetical protein